MRLDRYAVVCSQCGADATHRIGSALLPSEYGVGFYCEQHIPPATREPVAIYLLSPPGVAGSDHPGTKIREDWPSGYEDHARHPSIRTTTLTEYEIANRPTMALMNIWFAIMANHAPREFIEATVQERGDFYRALCMEIDGRVPVGLSRRADSSRRRSPRWKRA